MPTASQLLAAVDAAFEVTGRGLAPWADPHPDRRPPDEAYSRLTEPERWRIVGARATAWSNALVEAGLAVLEPEPSVRWREEPRTVISRTEQVVPLVAGALPLVVARSRLGDVDDAGVTLGVGDPALCVAWFPECGCDACDSGSQDELDVLDRHLLGVVTGAFRHLSSGDRTITVIAEGEWSASWSASEVASWSASEAGSWSPAGPGSEAGSSSPPRPFDGGEVDAILADPTGWDGVTGVSWLDHG